MIHVFYDLGKQIHRPLPYEPIEGKTHLIVMDVHQRRIRSEEMDVLKARRYVWVGNRKGNLLKDRLIVGGKKALRYLIFTTVFKILDKLKGSEASSMQTLVHRLKKLIEDLGVLELRDGRGKTFQMLRVDRLLEPPKQQSFLETLQKRIARDTGEDVSRLSSTEETLRAWASLYSKHGDFEKAVSEAFYEIVKEEVPSETSVLWTFGDENGVLTEAPGYRTYVEHTFFRSPLDDAQEGVCRICNRKSKITPKTTAFKFFKFFNTDKQGFAPLLDKELFHSLFGLCSSCYASVLEGDHFVWEKLKTKLADFEVILLPHPVPERGGLRELAEILKKRLSAVETVETWREFQQTLQEQAELWKEVREHIYMDLVFFKASNSNSAVKILKIIHEVPPSRLDALDGTRRKVLQWAEKRFRDIKKKGKSLWDMDLRTQYSLIPTRKEVQAPTLFLNYLEALLCGDSFSREALLKGFLEIARAHHFGRTEDFRGLSSMQRTVEEFIVQTLVLQYYAEKLGVLRPLIRGGESMLLDQLPDHLQSYLKDQIPPGKRWGLFLLGYVIGLIATAQQEGVPRNERKSPPILNTVTFTGMDEVKVRRLVNYVADRMRHYLKGWDYREGERLLAAALLLLEENKETLPSYENTYWVLAGYGFARLAIRKNKTENNRKD